MGFYNALNACFTLHQLNHSHWAELHEDGEARAKPEDGIASWRNARPISHAEVNSVSTSTVDGGPD
jgi:enoyl-CoA hydratase